MNDLKHVAFIMDGNGRWAKKNNKIRTLGHYEGVKRIGDIIRAGIEKNISHLSFFAFSTENWSRPKTEINYLLELFDKNFNLNTFKYKFENVQFNWIGFYDNLPKKIISKLEEITKYKVTKPVISVNIFFNYSGTKDLDMAFLNAKKSLDSNNIKNFLLTSNLPNVDLLIRTSGEQRISNFLLYEIAYAEIIFETTYWPDYSKKIFFNNLKEYNNRNRKFGKIKNDE